MASQSLLDIFYANADGHAAAVAAKAKRDGVYRDVTWGELGARVRSLATALGQLGVAPGDRVCILANSSLEWVVADMAILGAGGVTVPIYPSLLAGDCRFIVEDCGAVLVFAEDATQVEKLREVRAALPKVRKVVQLSGRVSAATGDDWVVSAGALNAVSDDAFLAQRRATLSPSSILTIIYTSGTTGEPKGVVLTHDNMLYEAQAVEEIRLIQPSDVQLFFLPLAHVFAKVLEVTWLSTRHVMAFAESMQTIKENLGEVRPTLMCGVPRIFEKFHTAVVHKGMAPGGVKSKLFAAALRLSQANGEAEMAGRSLPTARRLAFAALKKLVFKKVGKGLGDILGGRMRLMVSGGAPLSPQINWFFRDAGLLILEGYGLTETSAATFVNRIDDNRIGTVGPPLPRTDVRIAGDGEILVRGPGVMREYWRQPEATAAVLKDGWLHTGDIGQLLPGNYLKITDRKKDIIVTAGGKNVAPQKIENQLKAHKLISQVVIFGDKRKYITALITLDADNLRAFGKEHGLPEAGHAELSKHALVRKEIERAVDELNREVPSYEGVKRFHILDRDFSIESGELTPSLKVKRKVVYERYKSVFEQLYSE